MSSKIVSITNPTIHIHPKPTQFALNSQVLMKSRVSTTRNPTRARARAAAPVSCSYAPAQTKETLYELLGIGESVTSLSDIKKAYKQMARKYHPDVSPPERVDENTKRFIMVKEAYETLSDPQTRALYDRDLAVSFSPRKHRTTTGGMEEWQSTWKSQLDQLQRHHCRERSSWGARMRSC